MASKNFDFDIMIIGSGSAGSAAAYAAASAGLRVGLAENDKWGGSCMNYLDLPFRSASAFAHAYSASKQSSRFGISSSSLRFNYPTLMKWQSSSKKKTKSASKLPYEDAGITCLSGLAHFLSPYDLAVGSKTYSAPKFLIASGSNLSNGGIIGVESVECLTERTALSLSRPPKTLTIIGAGPTGVELAEYFSALGTKVCLIELSARILPREDEEVGNILGTYLEESAHIHILTQTRVISVSKTTSGIRISFLRGGLEKCIISDSVLLATGHKPALDLGLENAGVTYDSCGVKTDDFLQTSMKHIYAAGSCTSVPDSRPKTTELSSYEGALAASNIFNRQRNLVSRSGFIRLTNTSPSVSCVGLSEEDCLREGIKYTKSLVPLSSVVASIVEDFRVGFLKLIVDSGKHLIGASLMCPNSELLASELALAVRHRLSVVELASSPAISSSWGELIRLAARPLAK